MPKPRIPTLKRGAMFALLGAAAVGGFVLLGSALRAVMAQDEPRVAEVYEELESLIAQGVREAQPEWLWPDEVVAAFATHFTERLAAQMENKAPATRALPGILKAVRHTVSANNERQTEVHAAALGEWTACLVAIRLKEYGHLDLDPDAIEARLTNIRAILTDAVTRLKEELRRGPGLLPESETALEDAVRQEMERLGRVAYEPLSPLAWKREWQPFFDEIRDELEKELDATIARILPVSHPAWSDRIRQPALARGLPKHLFATVSGVLNQRLVMPFVPYEVLLLADRAARVQSAQERSAGPIHRAYSAQLLLLTAADVAACVYGTPGFIIAAPPITADGQPSGTVGALQWDMEARFVNPDGATCEVSATCRATGEARLRLDVTRVNASSAFLRVFPGAETEFVLSGDRVLFRADWTRQRFGVKDWTPAPDTWRHETSESPMDFPRVGPYVAALARAIAPETYESSRQPATGGDGPVVEWTAAEPMKIMEPMNVSSIRVWYDEEHGVPVRRELLDGDSVVGETEYLRFTRTPERQRIPGQSRTTLIGGEVPVVMVQREEEAASSVLIEGLTVETTYHWHRGGRVLLPVEVTITNPRGEEVATITLSDYRPYAEFPEGWIEGVFDAE